VHFYNFVLARDEVWRLDFCLCEVLEFDFVDVVSLTPTTFTILAGEIRALDKNHDGQ
jgi:hypothetical protein